jgi:hypothetical protein
VKYHLLLVFATAVATGCTSPFGHALSWRPEYLVHHRLELKIDDLVAEYVFAPDGVVEMTLQDGEARINEPDLRWNLKDGKLVISSPHGSPITMTLVKKEGREITVLTSSGQVWSFEDLANVPLRAAHAGAETRLRSGKLLVDAQHGSATRGQVETKGLRCV